MGKTERILEAILAVLSFILGVSTFIMAVITFTEKKACSIVRGLVWLTASGLWFSNWIYALMDLDILSITITVDEDEALND